MNNYISASIFMVIGGLLGNGAAVVGGGEVSQVFKNNKTGEYLKIGKLNENNFGVGLFKKNGDLVGVFGLVGSKQLPGVKIRRGDLELFFGFQENGKSGICVSRKNGERVFLGISKESRIEMSVFGGDHRLSGRFYIDYFARKGGFSMGRFDSKEKMIDGIEMKTCFGISSSIRVVREDGHMINLISKDGKYCKIEVLGGKNGGAILATAGKTEARIELQPQFGKSGLRILSSNSGWGSGIQIFDQKGVQRIRLGLDNSTGGGNIQIYDKKGNQVWAAVSNDL